MVSFCLSRCSCARHQTQRPTRCPKPLLAPHPIFELPISAYTSPQTSYASTSKHAVLFVREVCTSAHEGMRGRAHETSSGDNAICGEGGHPHSLKTADDVLRDSGWYRLGFGVSVDLGADHEGEQELKPPAHLFGADPLRCAVASQQVLFQNYGGAPSHHPM